MSLSEQTKKIQSFIRTHHEVNGLNEKEVSDFYIELIDCLVDHNHQYYIENMPIISDQEYDELFDYLKKIEEHFPQIITSNSPTQSLIGQVSEGFVQAQHETKLLSLENTYNAKDLEERDERVYKILLKQDPDTKISYHIEPKFDGISVELIYKKGIFTQAITRGDGLVGEDITENVRTIRNIPKKLRSPLDIHVRGEILMPKSVWRDINKEREEEGDIPFANTRNAAAGSIKLLDPKEVTKRGLICYVYDILQPETGNLKLGTLGLPAFPREKDMETIQEIIDLCQNPETKKYLDQQDSEFDGLVIKVKNKQQREIIGTTDHHPRWAVAYKFPAQLAATQILSVDFQVGRTGIITPVANLEPVQLSGAKLQRVSLHNFDFINEKDIHLHDWIRLQRSGEVIPYIVSVITDRRTGKETKINPPKTCPSCHEGVTNIDIHYYCTNQYCPEKIKQQIQHFVSKNCMDIQGIGESIVDLLVENKIIENIADIYKLTDNTIQVQLLKFPGIADKKVAEITKGVEESKSKALRRLLNGLGIPHVGKKMAQDISEQLNSENIISQLTNQEFLRSIYGIGEKSVETITQFFSNKEKLQLFHQLQSYGVNMDPKKYSDLLRASDAKASFSITGSFDLSRDKIAEYFQQNGYLFHESPTKTTDFMLIGDKAGSKKVKAQELGLIIYEGRDTIVKQFPFLKDIQNEGDKSKTQSLF
ncbi:MAG: NAD-dependent DNA ligase LigA [Candidatus Absconditabacterales bacterium]